MAFDLEEFLIGYRTMRKVIETSRVPENPEQYATLGDSYVWGVYAAILRHPVRFVRDSPFWQP
jgi:hypothetical protein